jgi:glycosyltransferase involved in cell wall biosynthesis
LEHFEINDDPAGYAALTDLFAERFGDYGGTVVTASEAMLRRLGDSAAARLSTQIPLPIDVDRYEHADRPREPICLFTSMPTRGLDVVLKIWPAIRRAVPAAQLLVTSGLQLWGVPAGEAQDHLRRTIGGMPTPAGVSILGALSRRDLIAVQQRGWLTLYPCRYDEMFCISAAESAAAGAPMVTSAHEALIERVQHQSTGLLIPGNIDEDETQHTFIEATVGLLRDPQTRDRFAAAGRRQVAAYEPNVVAEQWERLAF